MLMISSRLSVVLKIYQQLSLQAINKCRALYGSQTHPDSAQRTTAIYSLK